MKRLLLLAMVLLLSAGVFANDGVFYTSGNHLVPVVETDISVKKEILALKREGKQMKVTVYYEFFNPTKEKSLLVGFEAPPAYPFDESLMKKFPEHSHINDFTVTINGETMPYEVAVVKGYEMKDYYHNGKFDAITKEYYKEMIEKDDMWTGYYYVYHFNATFRKGLNIVQHTYYYDLSGDVCDEYMFNYILTAANRWANHQIDDFTLHIDMGCHESFSVKPTFFKSLDEWTIDGVGKKGISRATCGMVEQNAEPYPIFHIRQGSVTFHKTDFHPEGELEVSKSSLLNFMVNEMYGESPSIDVFKEQYFGLISLDDDKAKLNYDKDSRHILKNMPFAYRGYVFKNTMLKKYFESTNWYMPDPEYKSDMTTMDDKEKEWINFWKD